MTKNLEHVLSHNPVYKDHIKGVQFLDNEPLLNALKEATSKKPLSKTAHDRLLSRHIHLNSIKN
ncbi:MAG: hypothetical protein HQM16_16375 [Deltaproteobacteria bacterium]|nr:hypothetical protein [Deltaproteobacteria bacterium]